KQAKTFTLFVRVPNDPAGRENTLYRATPKVGISDIVVNGGKPWVNQTFNGYLAINREWHAGDKVEFTLPLAAQRVHADEHVAADRGMVALRYGPMIYNIETADGQDINKVLAPNSPLTAEWRNDMLQG